MALGNKRQTLLPFAEDMSLSSCFFVVHFEVLFIMCFSFEAKRNRLFITFSVNSLNLLVSHQTQFICHGPNL